MKKLILGMFAFLAVVSFAVPAFAVGEVKYAFVDVAKIFDQYQKTKENDRTLQDQGKKKEEERDALVLEIRQMKDELALVNEDAKAKKQEALGAKMKDLQDFDGETRNVLGEQRNKVVREIFKDIDDSVKRFGERKGLDLVFNERALLYHNPKYDATGEILTEINTNYAKNKKK